MTAAESIAITLRYGVVKLGVRVVRRKLALVKLDRARLWDIRPVSDSSRATKLEGS